MPGKTTKGRLEKLKLLTISDEDNPQYGDAKKARKQDLLRQKISILAKKASAAHNRRWYGFWLWGKNSFKWNRLEGTLGALNRKVREGKKLKKKDWEDLKDAAQKYNGKDKKKQAVVDEIRRVCKLALSAEELTPKQDEALIDFYKREQRGEFSAAKFVRDHSYWLFYGRHYYPGCRDLHDQALTVLDKADDYVLGFPDGEKKAAYEAALQGFAQSGEECCGKGKEASELGGIAEAAVNLAPGENDSDILKHAKSMFAHIIRLWKDLKSAESGWDSTKYQSLVAAAYKYARLMFDVIAGRKEEVDVETDYREAFEQLQRCAENYLTMKLKLGKMSEKEKDALMNQLKEYGTECLTDEKQQCILHDRRTKKKVHLMIDILKLTPVNDDDLHRSVKTLNQI